MKDTIKKVSEDLGISKHVVESAYKSFWEYIRNSIQELPLKEDLTEEEFNKLKTNFNIPSLGKLYCNYSRYDGIRNRFKYIKSLINDNNNKED